MVACTVAGVGSVSRVRSTACLVAEAVATVAGVSSLGPGVFVAAGIGVFITLRVTVSLGVIVGGALVSEGVADTAGVAGTVSVARAVPAVGEIAVGDSTSLVVVGAGSVVCASIRI